MIVLCVGKKSGLLSYCTLRSCRNRVRACSLCRPEQRASRGSPGLSLPRCCGSPSVSSSFEIQVTFIKNIKENIILLDVRKVNKVVFHQF